MVFAHRGRGIGRRARAGRVGVDGGRRSSSEIVAEGVFEGGEDGGKGNFSVCGVSANGCSGGVAVLIEVPVAAVGANSFRIRRCRRR